jgi:hypothetical protein
LKRSVDKRRVFSKSFPTRRVSRTPSRLNTFWLLTQFPTTIQVLVEGVNGSQPAGAAGEGALRGNYRQITGLGFKGALPSSLKDKTMVKLRV